MRGERLTVYLSQPISADLVRRILEIPSVLSTTPTEAQAKDASPMTRYIIAELEEAADVEETAYLIESLPGVREVRI